MGIDALADELKPGTHDEVALHLIPCKVELVRGAPHVDASAGKTIFLSGRIVSGRARDLRTANITVLSELADRAALRGGQRAGRQAQSHKANAETTQTRRNFHRGVGVD